MNVTKIARGNSEEIKKRIKNKADSRRVQNYFVSNTFTGAIIPLDCNKSLVFLYTSFE